MMIAVSTPLNDALAAFFDERFRALAVAAGASELTFPETIARDVLRRAGYFESFPENVQWAGPDACYQPAVCYHCYAQLAGQRVDGELAFTARGACRRNETSETLGRRRTFTMREIVFVGSEAALVKSRQQWMERIFALAREHGITARLEPATDPFFAAAGRGKRLMQQLKGLKYELRADVGQPDSLAIASFNLHERFFSERFDFRLKDGGAAASACVAFGLERWAIAAAAGGGYDLDL